MRSRSGRRRASAPGQAAGNKGNCCRDPGCGRTARCVDGGRRGAQDRHRAVRRHQGVDGADRGPRPRRGARDRRPGAQDHDGSGASLRWVRRAIDRRRHLRAVRRPGRTRGPSAAGALCGAAHAGGDPALLGPVACRWAPADPGASGCEQRRGGDALGRHGRACRVRAGRAFDQPGCAHAGAGADRFDRDHQCDAEARGRLLSTQGAGTDAREGGERAGRDIRSDGPRAASDETSTLRGPRAHEVRRAAARDGCDEACGGAGEVRSRADRSGDGGGRSREVAVVLRVQGGVAIGLDGARSVLGLARKSVRIPVGPRLAALLLQDRGRRRSARAPGEGGRQDRDPRPRAAGHASLSVRAAGNRRGRRPPDGNGCANPQAPHARSAEAPAFAREPQSAADRHLRGPALGGRARRKRC